MKLDNLLQQVDHAKIHEHLKYLSSFEKLSGSEAASEAAHYIQSKVKEYGIDCNLETFDGFLSNPVESTLKVLDENLEIHSRPRSFSRQVPEGLTGELVYDPSNIDKSLTDAQIDAKMKTFRGKIVVSHGFDERYEKKLEANGALALIQVWTSGEALIHEDTVSGIWGTPTKDTSLLLPAIPVLGVTQKDGEMLMKLLEEKPIRVEISSKLDTRVFPCEIPVAEIKGQSEDFILMSCHYDTWYLGAFDNCAANAAAIEMAKVFYDNRDTLKRSIRICWWAGHSNGRYAGSTWYNDNHYFELQKNCFAHVTADLLGARGCDLVGIRTTGVEGHAFTKENANTVEAGVETLFFKVGRGADQSFWGANIPIHFYTRYEQSPSKKTSDSPGPGVYWWHTEDDTYDRIDAEVYKKDVNLFFLNIYRLLTDDRLPFAPEEYFGGLLDLLDQCNQGLPELSCNPIIACVEELKSNTQKLLENCSDETYRWVLKYVGGNMNRICQSYGSPYDQDLALSGAPIFTKLLAFSGKTKETVSPEEYVFLRTDFIRQSNRVISEITAINQTLTVYAAKNK